MSPEGIRISLSVLIVVLGLIVLPDFIKIFFKKISNVRVGFILFIYIIAAAVTTGLIFG